MNCFVTGAGGFIGHHLCLALKAHSQTIVSGQRHAVDGPWERTILFDLEGRTVSPNELQGISCVFHLAAKAHALGEVHQDEQEYFRINVTGTRKLLESSKAAGVRRFVLFSSVKAIGEGSSWNLSESADCHPETPYGRSKLEAERMLLEGGYVPEPVVLRLPMVYGPTHKGNLPQMIKSVAKGYFPPLSHAGNKRSMVHVDDVVQAALLAAEKKKAAGKTYIVTDGQAYSTRQIYEYICHALDKPIPKWSVPIGILRILAKSGDAIGRVRRQRFMFDSDALDKLIGSAWYTSEKCERELGFHPRKELHSSLPGIVSKLDLK